MEYARPIDILLVEDNPGDVRLTIEALRDAKLSNNMQIAKDGEQAIDMLWRNPGYEDLPIPDLIILDLNLPRIDGREVLQRIKAHDTLKRIPVVVLTTSSQEEDILKSYNLHANCYITKPVDLDKFIDVVKSIESFWLAIVKLPRKE